VDAVQGALPKLDVKILLDFVGNTWNSVHVTEKAKQSQQTGTLDKCPPVRRCWASLELAHHGKVE